MITIRRSEERGHADRGWLDSRHTFSFADYHDPAHMGFRTLRVINEDRVAGGGGFPTHPHRDMEIVTLVLEGALEHRDSSGGGGVIRVGDVQRMTAGTGILHSEMNPSQDEPVHLFQIWILPDRRDLAPEYGQRHFPLAERRGRLRPLVSPEGREGSLTIHQDATLYGALLDAGERVEYPLPDRHAWVQVASGSVRVNKKGLGAGDGAAVSDEERLVLEAESAAELLLFDLS